MGAGAGAGFGAGAGAWAAGFLGAAGRFCCAISGAERKTIVTAKLTRRLLLLNVGMCAPEAAAIAAIEDRLIKEDFSIVEQLIVKIKSFGSGAVLDESDR